MKTYKNSVYLLVIITVFTIAIAGCAGSNTVSSFIVSDRQYTELTGLASAKQPEQLTAGKDIYACVYVIESPKGMEYTVKWFINGNEVKTDTQKQLTDRKGMIVFSLEGDKVAAGTLKFEISYDGDVLASRQLVITEK